MVDKVSQRLISVLDAIKDGIYIIDADYTLEFMNKAMVGDFGEGIGEKCYQIINKLEDICPWCRAKEVFKGETIHWEHHMPNVDKIYDLLEHPLENTDGTISKLSVCRDITQRNGKRRSRLPKKSTGDYLSTWVAERISAAKRGSSWTPTRLRWICWVMEVRKNSLRWISPRTFI
jgi:hypothetical protein